MTDHDLMYRPRTHEDTPALLALFQRVFGHQAEPAWWHWKYQDAALPLTLGQVAQTPAGALVAHVGLYGWPARLPDGLQVLAQVCDVMVDGPVRGGLKGGVYDALMAGFCAQVQQRHPQALTFGFPGNRSLPLGRRLGFYHPWYEVLDQELPALTPPRRPTWHRLEAIPMSDQALDQVAAQAAGATGHGLIHSPAYLDWRYRRHPARHYRLCRLETPLGGRGWCMVQALPDHLRVMEWWGREPDLPRLLTLVRHQAAREGLPVVRYWAPPASTVTTGSTALPTGATVVEMTCAPRPRLQGGIWPRLQPGDADIY
ncbi:Acetyltransferase (GNAT) domain-containing protein [Ectothiorhodospira magna]|uniref:Acetyltransferase (GNAT) domain-containing protein n=1 Tax=Ectothiorhodospira magna TaxID=867345 RepID=A0A1H9BJS1_9GAMM|nr:GNAT family N-acetyltransferase [Ectothiorhodospira magna]SEP89119.1 Acetyltransferase (GNAT) domain-containing protein [Ectothiorhodospira magna]